MEINSISRRYLCKMQDLIKSEALPGVLLILSTIVALIMANGPLAESYHYILNDLYIFKGFNLHAFINDFLMALFFLSVGCEIKKEIVNGHLSDIRKALFPIVAAVGGVIVPAIIFFILNKGTSFSNGVGIPISTDIAFAIGAFMLFKKKLNTSLKIFLLTLAVVDDLMSIAVIGIFYSSGISFLPLMIAVLIFTGLILMKKINKSQNLYPYFILGMFLWIFIFISGIHATIAGVLLAFTIPIRRCDEEKCECLLTKVEHRISPYANYLILPLFALSNTAISLQITGITKETVTLSLGIIIGLVLGKPLGIMLFTIIGTKLKLIEKPSRVKWYDVACVSTLAGIGFTMSIFVSDIALQGNIEALNIAKISILFAAILSCTVASIAIAFQRSNIT